MNAVASTLSSDQPPIWYGEEFRQRLAKINEATRKLREDGVRVVGQDLLFDFGERPVLFVSCPQPPKKLFFGLKFSRFGTRKDGVRVRIYEFGDVDLAWTVERAS